MTVEAKFTKMLFERGMFPAQAESVMDLAKQEPALAEMERRWQDDESEYPPALLAVYWVTICAAAVKWIDKNLPQAWYRPLFTPEGIAAADVAS